MNYSAKILEYFEQRSHAGALPAATNVLVGEASAANEELLRFYVQIENQQIQRCTFQANASVASIASAEFLAQWCEQKRVDELATLSAEFIAEQLALPAVKIHSVRLALSALNSAIAYKEKK